MMDINVKVIAIEINFCLMVFPLEFKGDAYIEMLIMLSQVRDERSGAKAKELNDYSALSLLTMDMLAGTEGEN